MQVRVRIVGIDPARENVRTNDQHGFSGCITPVASENQCVNKSRARTGEIDRTRSKAESVRDQRRGRRKQMIGSAGGQEEQADAIGLNICASQSRFAGADR